MYSYASPLLYPILSIFSFFIAIDFDIVKNRKRFGKSKTIKFMRISTLFKYLFFISAYS